MPFYISRYEKDLVSGNNLKEAADDLIYFRNEIIRLHKENELSDLEMTDLIGFMKTIITHITNGNENEERLVNIMGGVIIETESEKLMKQGIYQGKVQMIVEMGQEVGLNDLEILQKLQEKIGLSFEEAKAYLNQYGKQLVHINVSILGSVVCALPCIVEAAFIESDVILGVF